MEHIKRAFRPSRENYLRWAWCMACGICGAAWLHGQSGWAGVAAFNAACVVWAYTVGLDA